MEPTFTDVSSETVTAELVAQLTTAIAALPPPTAPIPVRTSLPSQERQHIPGSRTGPSQRDLPLSPSLQRQRTARLSDSTLSVLTTKRRLEIPVSSKKPNA